MIYLAYATAGKEFEVSQALSELGYDHWCGRRIDFVRKGKERRAEAVESPKISNYLFISLSDTEWHRLQRELARKDKGSRVVSYEAEGVPIQKLPVGKRGAKTKEKDPLKHLASTMYLLRRDDEKELERFRTLVDTDHANGLRIAERGNKAEMAQFQEGQKLIDLQGRFGEQVLRFRKIVEASLEFPHIEAETEMMGRVVTVRLDPLDVKAYE